MTDQLRVLLVEDDVYDVEVVKRSLSTIHPAIFDVKHVSCFVDAVREIKHQRFHVVILDLGLPDSVGLNGVRRVMELIPKVPVIVLTGLDDEEAAMEALELGAQEFLAKSDISTKQLIRTIRHAIKRKQVMLEQSGDPTARSDSQTLQRLADLIRNTTEVVTSHVGSLMKTDLTANQKELVGSIRRTSLQSAEEANRLVPSSTPIAPAEAIIDEPDEKT